MPETAEARGLTSVREPGRRAAVSVVRAQQPGGSAVPRDGRLPCLTGAGTTSCLVS